MPSNVMGNAGSVMGNAGNVMANQTNTDNTNKHLVKIWFTGEYEEFRLDYQILKFIANDMVNHGSFNLLLSRDGHGRMQLESLEAMLSTSYARVVKNILEQTCDQLGISEHDQKTEIARGGIILCRHVYITHSI